MAPTRPPTPRPPIARATPRPLRAHGHVRLDEYYWLREPEDPEVLRYLEAENAYTEAVMAHTRALRDSLFHEIKGRIRQSDTSAPVWERGYWYYTRFEEGSDYPIFARREGSLDAPEQVLLDANDLAAGHAYLAVGSRVVSPSAELLAFTLDTRGRRIYTLHFRDLRTGELLPDRIPGVTPNVVWANDNRTVLYARQDPRTLRWDRIYRHELGTDPARDALIYREDDETFGTSVFRARSDRYLMIASHQTVSSEVRYLDADDPGAKPAVFLPRERGHEYELDHFGDHFYLRTNSGGARSFRLVRASGADTVPGSWEEVVPHRPEVFLEGFELFRDHLVLSERSEGLTQIRIRPWTGPGEHAIDFGEPAYHAFVGPNPDPDARVLRFGYTSLTTPASAYDYDMVTRERRLVKRDEVLGGFDPADYASERVYAPARDGIRVPVSIVYRRGMRRDGSSPLLLYGYGAYGRSVEAAFSAARLSLLDRGFVFAIAHVRGGQELGRAWYERGRLLQKRNTFTDFIDAAEHLVRQGYTRPDRLFAHGGSAGGLLVGAVLNMRPDLFHGAIAAVPFVDLLTTMLDPGIPLTTGEYDEWGDPNDPTYYHYMLSYSPYDNVERKAYPHLLVTTGLHDSQVQYWEPAKWVARLRARKTDRNRLLLKIDMDAGHGGASARSRQYEEIAFQYAFLLDLARAATGGTVGGE